MSYQSTPFRQLARVGWQAFAPSFSTWAGRSGTVVYRGIGAQQAYELVGTSRDAGGTLIGLCPLVMFDTATGTPLQQTVSDASGNFRFDNPGVGPFYIVLYKSGVQVGMSANSLRPTVQIRPAPTGSVGWSTTFPATENPISQGGVWLGGLADGLDWQNFQTGSSHAYAAAFSSTPPPPYNDALAILKSSAFACASNQYAEIVVFRAVAYNPSNSHECGMFIRFSLSANNAHGYEAYLNHSANFSIIRWNGLLNDFTPLTTTGPGPTAPVDGDVLRFEVVGSTLKYYQNGTLVATATDTTYTSGQAGMQSFASTAATLANYGMKSFACGNL